MPIVALSINFIYHPMPMYGPPPQADITTPEKEEKLLSPMRMQHHKTQNVPIHWTRVRRILNNFFIKLNKYIFFYYNRTKVKNLTQLLYQLTKSV